MLERPDGRMYSRVTRRCRTMLESLPDGIELDVSDASDLILEKNPDAFYLARFERTISKERLRVYLRYLAHLEAIEIREGVVKRSFHTRSTDQQWAQALADLARKGLAPTLGVKAAQVPDKIGDAAKKVLKSGQAPTIPVLIQNLTGATGQDEEYARWNLYLIADGPNAVLEIRRYPTLWVS